MTRTPLRPLARILAARRDGENPDSIERENLRQRHEEARDGARARAEGRLLILSVFFLCAFFLVGIKMSALAASDPAEPKIAATGAQIIAARGARRAASASDFRSASVAGASPRSTRTSRPPSIRRWTAATAVAGSRIRSPGATFTEAWGSGSRQRVA